MPHPLYPRVLTSLLSTLALAACGSSADTPTDAGGADAGTSDGGAPDAGAPPDAPATPVTTATVTWNGATTTVPLVLRRGLSFFAPTGAPSAFATYGNALSLSCAPNASAAEGGRVISRSSISVGIGGPVVGNCASNQAQIPNAEAQIATQIRAACGNGVSTCTFDPTSALDTYLFECGPQNLTVQVLHDCRAMDPGASFVLETETPSLRISGLEAPGTASCAARGVRFAADGLSALPQDGTTCEITITERADRTLAGTITATLAPAAPGGSPRPLTMTFEHNRNQLLPVIAVNTGTDLCLTNAVTHTERTEGGETYDDYVGAAPHCQQANTTLGAITVTRRRPRAGSSLSQDVACGGGRLDVAIEGVGATSNAGGGCAAAYAVTESAEVLRFVTQGLDLCPAGGGACGQQPIVYMALGVGDASAPLPQ